MLQRRVDRLSDRLEQLNKRVFLLKSFRFQIDQDVTSLSAYKTGHERLALQLDALLARFNRIQPPQPAKKLRDALPQPPNSPAPAPKTDDGEARVRADEGAHVNTAGEALRPSSIFVTSRLQPPDSSPPDPTNTGSELRAIADEDERLNTAIDALSSQVATVTNRLSEVARSLTEMLESEVGLRRSRRRMLQEEMRGPPWHDQTDYARTGSLLETTRGHLADLERQLTNANRLAVDVKQRIDNLSATTAQDIQSSTTDQGQLEQKLQSDYLRSVERQGSDSFLILTIIAMIVAMIVLYCSLLLFKEELAYAIVEERVLLELMSMGFLILTVIILGTGRLLTVESLAALLGTIAGYIFGRKAMEDDDEPSNNKTA